MFVAKHYTNPKLPAYRYGFPYEERCGMPPPYDKIGSVLAAHQQLRRGVGLFNNGSYFEAHEVLEDVWREARAVPEKTFLQGLVQLAVAFHHYSTGNLTGARSVLGKASRNLNGAPPLFHGINAATLQAEVREWAETLADSGSLPQQPRIRFTSSFEGTE